MAYCTGITWGIVLFIVFVCSTPILGAEPLAGFRMQPVPIFCGPADKLRDKLLKSQSNPVFSGTALGGTFLIFKRPAPSQEFVVTFWRLGEGCIVATGTDAKIHESIQWTMRGEDGGKNE